jgi:hypothetical protein
MPVGWRRTGVGAARRRRRVFHSLLRAVEGIVSKRLTAPYRLGPSRDWIKVKNPDAPRCFGSVRGDSDQVGVVLDSHDIAESIERQCQKYICRHVLRPDRGSAHAGSGAPPRVPSDKRRAGGPCVGPSPVPTATRWLGSLDLAFLSGQIHRMLAPRFPAPWSVLEIPGGFRVQDANRRPLAYFYGSEDPSARHRSDVLTLDDARRMAEKFAGLGSA